MGLRPHAAVRYRGVDVGDVRSIHLDPAHPGRIAIPILVNRDTPVTHSTFGSSEFQGVTGIRFVQLDVPGAIRRRCARRQAASRKSRCSRPRMRSSDARHQLTETAASLRHAARSLSVLMQQARAIISQLPATASKIEHTLLLSSALISSLNAPDGQLRSNLGKPDTGTMRIDEAASSIRHSLEDLSASVGDDLRVNLLAARGPDR